MPGPSSPSFIPKQNPTKLKRVAVSRQLYVVTIVSYLLIFAALIASAGVFFYERYSSRILVEETQGLDRAINAFDINSLDRVLQFNDQLANANTLLDSGISIGSILTALEASTVITVQVADFTLEHTESNTVEVQMSLVTDSFDSVLFQREVYQAVSAFDGLRIEELSINLEEGGTSGQKIDVTMVFSVDPSVVPYPSPVVASPTTVDAAPSVANEVPSEEAISEENP